MKKSIFILFLLIFISTNISKAQKAGFHDFKATDIYGELHHITNYLDAGKHVFIDFYTVACSACQMEAPYIDTVYRELGCNYNNIIFLSVEISSYTINEDVYEFCQEFSMSFDAISGGEGGGNAIGVDLYEIGMTPWVMLVDPDRKLLIYDYFHPDTQGIRDTLAYYDLYELYSCEGADFELYRLVTENDTIFGDVDKENKTVNVQVPFGTDLNSLTSIFVISSEAIAYVDESEQTSAVTYNDFSSGELTYYLEAENSNYNNDWVIYVEELSEIETFNSNINIFPNPTTGEFIITVDANYKLEIINITGKNIYTQKLTQAQTDIDLTEQKPGIYLIRLTNNEGIFNYKIVVE